ncbi:MAG TPA: hypothetical protein VFK20_16955 [Vicinamibacterales bacterium]|nr:hypothetical protein [Vicinamibacterales bacterium]
MAEHTKQPNAFSGRASGSVTVTCDHCGAVLDVLCLAARDDGALASYTVRCPSRDCAVLLQVELPSPPIAVMPHHG